MWADIVDLMFGRQLHEIFRVFLLNIFLSGCSFGKDSFTAFKKSLPMFVLTFRSNGGLYHVMSLFLFLSCVLLFCCCSSFVLFLSALFLGLKCNL